jgi:hypothetical protein
LSRKKRIARLSDGGVKSVEDARVLVCAREPLQTRVELAGIVLGELGNRADTEKVEIAFDCRTDGDQVAELPDRAH